MGAGRGVREPREREAGWGGRQVDGGKGVDDAQSSRIPSCCLPLACLHCHRHATQAASIHAAECACLEGKV